MTSYLKSQDFAKTSSVLLSSDIYVNITLSGNGNLNNFIIFLCWHDVFKLKWGCWSRITFGQSKNVFLVTQHLAGVSYFVTCALLSTKLIYH